LSKIQIEIRKRSWKKIERICKNNQVKMKKRRDKNIIGKKDETREEGKEMI